MAFLALGEIALTFGIPALVLALLARRERERRRREVEAALLIDGRYDTFLAER